MTKKGVYVGSLNDITPLVLFDDIDTWVYIGMMPNGLANLGDILKPPKLNNETIIDWYLTNKDSFFDIIEKNMNIAGLSLVENDKENKVMIFKRDNVATVYYIYNTTFYHGLTEFHKSLLQYISVIYICGFIPDYRILNFVKSPVFYLDDNTSYEHYIHNGLIFYLDTNGIPNDSRLILIKDRLDICNDINYNGSFRQENYIKYKKHTRIECKSVAELISFQTK